jgi:hypothetical protein
MKNTIDKTPSELIKVLADMPNDKKYDLVLHKEKRSIQANDYFWTLCNKIAEVLHTDKDSVHLRMLKEYGQVAETMLPEKYDINEFYDYYDELKPIVKNGKKFRVYKIYQASHKMNVNQMYHLIQGVRSEAQELDINVLTPNEIADMMSRYEKTFNK